MAAFRITSEQTLQEMHDGFDAFEAEAEAPYFIQDDRDDVYTFTSCGTLGELQALIAAWKASNPIT